jgi:hypothetical protein
VLIDLIAMRTLVILSVLALCRMAHAEPCVNVTGSNAEDAAAVRKVVLAAFPTMPRACIDISISPIALVSSAAEVTLAASVRVMISDDHGRMTSVVSGGATVHVQRGQYKTTQLASYRRDALEEAIAGITPGVRTRLTPPPVRPGS